MSLIETLDYLMHFDYSITFKKEIGHFSVNLSRKIDDKSVEKSSWLPFDHMDEGTITDCLKYMQTEIQKEF